MAAKEIVKTILICLLMIFIVIGNIFVIRNKRKYFVHLLKYIWTVVLLSQILSGTVSAIGLLLSNVAAGWLQESVVCQLFGFLNLVLNSGTVWIMAIAALERYCRFVLPSEHSSTFSRRNLNLMTAGVYILVTLIATGPLYGLGEYSNLRGHLSLMVNGTVFTPNTSIALYDNRENEVDIIRYYLQILGNVAAGHPNLNPMTATEKYIENNIGAHVRTSSWTEQGMMFILRAPNIKITEKLWLQIVNGDLNRFINTNIMRLNISLYFGRDDIGFYTYVNESDYLIYRDVYIPSQDIGVCTVDFTSMNVHATFWCVYQLIITNGLPYFAMLVIYTIIFLKNPYVMSARDTTLNEEEIWSLKLFCSASMLCCLLATIYYTVTLCNSYGVYVSSDVSFAVIFLYYCSGMSLFILDRIIESSALTNTLTSFSKCWNVSKTSITQELTELSIKRDSLPKSFRRIKINKPTHL